MVGRISLVIFIFLLSLISIEAQKIYETSFLKEAIEATIPFDKIGGFIVVKVIINEGDPLNLILDTGAQDLVLFKYDKAKALGLQIDKEIELMGTDLHTQVKGYISREHSVALPNCTPAIKDLIVLKEDFIRLDETLGYPIDGLMGTRMFLGMVMQIDYRKQKMVLIRKTNFKPPDKDSGYTFIPIEIIDGKPYLTASYLNFIDKQADIKLLLDTGSSLNFLVFNSTDDEFVLSERFLRGPLGKGLGGDIMGYVGRLRKLVLHPSIPLFQIVSHFRK